MWSLRLIKKFFHNFIAFMNHGLRACLLAGFFGYFSTAGAMIKNHDEIYVEQQRFCSISIDCGRFLDLSSMRFDPKFLSNLPESLEELLLDGMRDEDGSCISLDASEFFLRFKNLKKLSAHCSGFGSVVFSDIAKIQGIVSLDLSGNQIGFCGVLSISKMKGITSLNLSNNQIDGDGAAYIAKMRGLLILDLSCNRIGNVGSLKIAKMSELMSLNLADNEISYMHRSYFELKRMNKLTVMNFANNPLIDFVSFIATSSIIDLNLSGTGFRDSDLNRINNSVGLRVLNLFNNKIGLSESWSYREAVFFDEMKDLRVLNLSFNYVHDLVMLNIVKLNQLTDLFFSRNQISDAGVLTLVELEQLTKLDLFENRITDVGAGHIAQMEQLKSLDLHCNQIGDSGARSISQMRQLRSLDLSDNQITDSGACLIAQMRGLASFFLFNNKITHTKIAITVQR